MSHGFNLKYDRMKENNPASTNADESTYEKHDAPKNICFVQTDGYRLSLSYAYLVCREYLPDGNTIILSFTSHNITIKGLHLESLFDLLQENSIRQIFCTDQRYNLTKEEESPVVNEIQIQKTNE